MTFLILALTLLAQGTASAALPACADGPQIDFAHKAQLPPGVAAALGFEMADLGESFQATDAIVHPGLPFVRFVSARQIGCRLQIVLDRGGRGLGRETIDLRLTRRGWTISGP